jgi:hypothetical protein
MLLCAHRVLREWFQSGDEDLQHAFLHEDDPCIGHDANPPLMFQLDVAMKTLVRSNSGHENVDGHIECFKNVCRAQTDMSGSCRHSFVRREDPLIGRGMNPSFV